MTRRIKAWIAVIALALVCSSVLPGQSRDVIEGFSRRTAPSVSLAIIDPVKVVPGKLTPVTLNFHVLPGYHINSNTPTSQLLLPTVLKLSPPTNITSGKTDYPPGQEIRFSFAPNEKLSVYTGDITMVTHIMATKNIPKGTYRVRGELQFQACDNRLCYPPGSIPVLFDVRVNNSRR